MLGQVDRWRRSLGDAGNRQQYHTGHERPQPREPQQRRVSQTVADRHEARPPQPAVTINIRPGRGARAACAGWVADAASEALLRIRFSL